jgi:ribosomal protein S18 acetylase RimI-like enzyme
MSPPELRPLIDGDLPAVTAIQNTVFEPLYRETQDVLGSRLQVGPTCCWGAFEDGELLAYILSHPWPAASPPAIGRPLPTPPAGDNWFIHDLAIAPRARGLRLGHALVRAAAGSALKLGLVRGDLIAVQGAWSFWAKLGYAPPPTLSEALQAKVAGYGPDARYMTATISALKA